MVRGWPAAPPLAVKAAASGTHVEREGDVDKAADRYAVLAHYSENPRVTRSFRALVRELLGEDYQVVVVSSASCAEPLAWAGDDIGGTRVIRKPNVGYDFGSWAVGLSMLPGVARADAVILANDSLVGPFASIRHLLTAFHATPADVWGMTETLQFTRHVQSYFLGFRRGVLTERPLAHFWSGVRHYSDKNLVIHRNELGLARLLQREGYAVDAAVVAGQLVAPGDNPTIAGWRGLLDHGVPFVKREIVRCPELAPDGETIGPEIMRRYGQDVAEWTS